MGANIPYNSLDRMILTGYLLAGGYRLTLYITRGSPHVHHVGSRKLLPYKGFGYLSDVY